MYSDISLTLFVMISLRLPLNIPDPLVCMRARKHRLGECTFVNRIRILVAFALTY